MVDGTIARKANVVSEFGARLDTVAAAPPPSVILTGESY